jgi:hypothetical protein
VKKSIILVIILILFFSTGCMQLQDKLQSAEQTVISPPSTTRVEKEIVPDISTLIAKETAAMQYLKSCRTNMHLEIELKSPASSEGNIFISADVYSIVDLVNRLLDSTISSHLSISGSNDNLTQKIIISGDTVYLKNSDQSPWQKKVLEGNDLSSLWNEQDAQLLGSKYSSLNESEGLVYAGQTMSENNPCFILKQNLDINKLLQMTPELMTQLQNLNGNLSGEITNIFQNAELIFLIDSQNYYLRATTVSVKLNGKVNGKQISGTMLESCRYNAFNEPVTINAPEVTQ